MVSRYDIPFPPDATAVEIENWGRVQNARRQQRLSGRISGISFMLAVWLLAMAGSAILLWASQTGVI